MASMKRMARTIEKTRPHLIKLLEQIGDAATRDKSDLIAFSGTSPEWILLQVGGVQIFFRSAYGLDGQGYLESGHYERDERGEQAAVTDLSLPVDQYGNVEQRYTIEEVAGELEALLDRTYEAIQRRFAGKQVRISGGIFDAREDQQA